MSDPGAQLIFILNLCQAILAFFVLLLLRMFYKNYQNRYFQFWSWSWLGLMIYMIASSVALRNLFYYEASHLFRIIPSLIAVGAALFHVMWLLLGSIELSQQKELGRRAVIIISALIIPITFSLVLLYSSDPSASGERGFLRIGIKSIIASIAFISSALIIRKIPNPSIGIRFIIGSFLVYGIEQFNYFMSTLFGLLGLEYLFSIPYSFGVIDLLLQALMGIGMLISVLEMEQQRLRKANSELDRFLYQASHYLRAPLTVIYGITQIFDQLRSRSEIDQFVEIIQDKVQQADQAVRDIIDLRKSQKTEPTMEKIDLRELIENTFQSLIVHELTKIRMEYSSSIDFIYSDAERLKLAISNILSNAINYHNHDQEDPTISVSVEEVNRGTRIVIEDNGQGIDQKVLPKVFDMFYRANRASAGSGLGLYMARDTLETIGGSIDVTSTLGRGTAFTIELKAIEVSSKD